MDFALIWVVNLVHSSGPVLSEVGPFARVAAPLGIVVTLLAARG